MQVLLTQAFHEAQLSAGVVEIRPFVMYPRELLTLNDEASQLPQFFHLGGEVAQGLWRAWFASCSSPAVPCVACTS